MPMANARSLSARIYVSGVTLTSEVSWALLLLEPVAQPMEAQAMSEGGDA
jgi:hypothetical protein